MKFVKTRPIAVAPGSQVAFISIKDVYVQNAHSKSVGIQQIGSLSTSRSRLYNDQEAMIAETSAPPSAVRTIDNWERAVSSRGNRNRSWCRTLCRFSSVGRSPFIAPLNFLGRR